MVTGPPLPCAFRSSLNIAGRDFILRPGILRDVAVQLHLHRFAFRRIPEMPEPFVRFGVSLETPDWLPQPVAHLQPGILAVRVQVRPHPGFVSLRDVRLPAWPGRYSPRRCWRLFGSRACDEEKSRRLSLPGQLFAATQAWQYRSSFSSLVILASSAGTVPGAVLVNGGMVNFYRGHLLTSCQFWPAPPAWSRLDRAIWQNDGVIRWD